MLENASKNTPFRIRHILFMFLIAEVLPVLFCLSVIKMTSIDHFVNHLYIFGTIAQFFMDLPPLLFLFIYLRKEFGSDFVNKKAIIVSLTTLALLLFGKWLFTSNIVFMHGVPAFQQSLSLPNPEKLFYSLSAFIAYGPGEAFFIITLLKAFGEKATTGKAIFASAVLWGFGHFTNIFWGMPLSSVIMNSFIMFFYGLFMGFIYKLANKSPISILILWSFTNGTVI